jgi:transglutaminase-like putative cysteine protease
MLALVSGGPLPARAAPSSAARWTDATPDRMVDRAQARALAAERTEHGQMASLAVIAALASRAPSGYARAALARLAANLVEPGPKDEAALLARMLSPDEGTEAGARADHALGVVEGLSVLGPFRDTGGGLDAHDGPEGERRPFDAGGRYAWGSYDVAWREIPRSFAQASGTALDVFIFPRKESCTWVASALNVANAAPLVVHLASTGQVRLVFDGADVARDEAVHESLRFDRLAVRVEATAGKHLLAVKVCTGALDDDGQVRLRLTNDAGAWPEGVTDAPWNAAGGVAMRRPVARSLTTALSRWTADPASAAARKTPVGSDRRLPADGSLDEKIDAAILRTLGGADDLRSPRAPGLLASLADAGLDADRLAMAAWVAPLGAQRSAWLNRAREQGDPSTRAFAERRLVERHIDAGLPDWAMASLRGAKLDQAPDPEAMMLTSRVELALGTDALRLRALQRLKAAMRAAKDAVPDDALELLARAAEALDPEATLAARELLAQRGYRNAERVRILAATGGRDAALAAARRAFDGGVGDAVEALSAAQAIARTGAHEDARALFEQLARWAPNRAPVWAGLAQELSAAPGDGTTGAAIAASLRRARELDPGEARYRAELALRARASATPPGGDGRDDEKYIVPEQTILARRSQGRTPADVADRQLHWLRAVVMHPDRRISEMVHYAREIVIAPRTEDELYEDIPAEGDQTELLRARVHRKDGGEAFPVEEANERGNARIRWPELSPGDVVEVAFRSWTAGPVGGRGDPPFYRLDYAGALTTHPIVYNEDVLEYPPDRPIYSDIVNGKADRREEHDEGGRHIVRFVWDRPPNVPDEPLAPPISEVVPVLVMSTFKDWNAFRAWYGDAVRGFTEPDAQVRELAARLTKGKATRDEKLRALFDFVADDVRYVNYVSGERWLPNRPQQLLARREGDCDDKAILLITLLKAVGMDAQEVMVQTRLTNEPSIVRARGAAIPLFDHGIAFLPGPGGGTYLDATSPQSRLGPLPSMDARAVALRLDGPSDIVALPSSSPDDHGLDAAWTVRLAAGGAAELQGEERATGDDAFFMRSYLTEPGTRAQWVEDHLVGPWFSTLEVDKKVDFHGDLPRGAALVAWRARSEALARHEGSELVLPLAPSQTTASQIAPLVTRTLPVWLPPSMAPRKESRAIRVLAPKGWRFEALPQGGDENGGPFGRAHLDIARDPRDAQAVLVKRTMVFDQSTISVEEYPRWRAWVQRVDALMHKSLRLEPAPAVAAGSVEGLGTGGAAR